MLRWLLKILFEEVTSTNRRVPASRSERDVEKRDGAVRINVHPSLPEFGVTLPSFHFHVRLLFLWNTEVRTRGMSSSAAPLSPPHATF